MGRSQFSSDNWQWACFRRHGAVRRQPHGRRGVSRCPASRGVAQYFRQQLQFPSKDTYIGVNFTANVAWTWDEDRDIAALMAQRIRADAGMRLFVASGLFDMATTGDGSGFLRAGMPAARLVFVSLPAGHEVYADAATHAQFGAAVRTFLQGMP
jgi:hypothetical protein